MKVGMEISNSFKWDKTVSHPREREWTKIEVTQQVAAGTQKHMLQIKVADKVVFEVENENPKEYSNVRVYASDPMWGSVDSKIREMCITTW